MPGTTVAVALAALVAAGCDADPRRGDGPPPAASVHSSTPATRDDAIPSRVPAPDAVPTVDPPSGVRVLAGPVSGAGQGFVATVHVPARFAVMVSCNGLGRFVIEVDGRGSLRTECGPNSDEFVYEPLGEPGQVTVRVNTLSSIRWAAVVTTALR